MRKHIAPLVALLALVGCAYQGVVDRETVEDYWAYKIGTVESMAYSMGLVYGLVELDDCEAVTAPKVLFVARQAERLALAGVILHSTTPEKVYSGLFGYRLLPADVVAAIGQVADEGHPAWTNYQQRETSYLVSRWLLNYETSPSMRACLARFCTEFSAGIIRACEIKYGSITEAVG